MPDPYVVPFLSTVVVPAPPSHRKYPLPWEPGSMNPFIDGLNPSGRRMLIMAPRGDDEVGIIVTTTITSMDHESGLLRFHVVPCTYKDFDVEITLATVVYDIEAHEMFLEHGAPCYFLVDNLAGNSVFERREFHTRRHPEAWNVVAL